MSIREKFEQSLRNLLKASGYSNRFKYREGMDDESVINDIMRIQASLVNVNKLAAVCDRINEFKDILVASRGESDYLVRETIKNMDSVVNHIRKGSCLYEEGDTPDKVFDQLLDKIDLTLTQIEIKEIIKSMCPYPEYTPAYTSKTNSDEHKEWKEKEAKYKESFMNLMTSIAGEGHPVSGTFKNPRNIEELEDNINFFIEAQSIMARFNCESHGFDIENMLTVLNTVIENKEDSVIKSKLKLIDDIITGKHLYEKGLSPFKLIEDTLVQLIKYLNAPTDAEHPTMKSDDVIKDIKVCIKERFKDLSELPNHVHLVLSKEEVYALINN